MNEAIVSCDPRLKTWMNLFSSLHRCLRPFHPVWMESSHRRAPKSWLCWSHVAPQHLPCMLFNLFFLPIYWPFHSAKAISFFNSTTFNPFGLLPDWRMPYILHEYWICVGVYSHAICFQRIIVDGMRLHTAV